MIGHGAHPQHHHRRYIFLMTVVVGAILILMLMNDDGELNLLTGSTIGANDNSEPVENAPEVILEEQSKWKGIPFSFAFDSAPEVKEETKLDSIKVVFRELSTNIKVNAEKLKLNGLENVKMEVLGLEGEVDFDEIKLSLAGKCDKVVVNGIEISTQGKMDVSFDGLVYEELGLEGVEFNMMKFEEGDGKIQLGEKMSYVLENEEIAVSKFIGNLRVGGEGTSLVSAEGEIGGVSVNGEFDLTLT